MRAKRLARLPVVLSERGVLAIPNQHHVMFRCRCIAGTAQMRRPALADSQR